MQDSNIFREVVQQYGFSAGRAQVALETITTQLRARGHTTHRPFYIYRTGGSSLEGAAAAGAARPRTLLAFATADSALLFVQRNALSPTPRLLRLPLAQLLAVLVQRPAIGALLVADEPIEALAPGELPAGLRLERALLLDLLKGAQGE